MEPVYNEGSPGRIRPQTKNYVETYGLEEVIKKMLLVLNPLVHWDVGIQGRCWSGLNKVWEEDRGSEQAVCFQIL